MKYKNMYKKQEENPLCPFLKPSSKCSNFKAAKRFQATIVIHDRYAHWTWHAIGKSCRTVIKPFLKSKKPGKFFFPDFLHTKVLYA